MNSNQNPIGVTLTRHVDRINNLPDDVITNSILSLLPTIDSVRTSALSTRWKHLYASVPVLDFQNIYIQLPGLIPSDSPFVNFLSKVLNTVTNKLSFISKFRISQDRPADPSNLVSWIETVVSHSVRELDVCYNMMSEYTQIPHCIFTCKTLVSLSLHVDFEFSVPDLVCLPKLKELRLEYIVLRAETDDGAFRRLFSSCPVLERLSVGHWYMEDSRVLNVSVPPLKVFNVSLFGVKGELIINFPNLEMLRCESYPEVGFSGDVIGSLKECYIEIEESGGTNGEKVERLMKQVCKAQFLTLAGESMEACSLQLVLLESYGNDCSLALLYPPISQPIFENLTCLELKPYYSYGWLLLPRMLRSSPCLEALVFPMGFFNKEDYDGVPFSPPKNVTVCLSFHLKVIKINRFLGLEDEYRLVEYFLRNAMVLEKLEISLWSSQGSKEVNEPCEEEEVKKEREEEEKVEGEGHNKGKEEGVGKFESDLERHFEITKRFLTFRRLSELCEILIVSSQEKTD